METTWVPQPQASRYQLSSPHSGGLSGVTVQVTDSGGRDPLRDPALVYAGQINAVLPSATALGQASADRYL